MTTNLKMTMNTSMRRDGDDKDGDIDEHENMDEEWHKKKDGTASMFFMPAVSVRIFICTQALWLRNALLHHDYAHPGLQSDELQHITVPSHLHVPHAALQNCYSGPKCPKPEFELPPQLHDLPVWRLHDDLELGKHLSQHA